MFTPFEDVQNSKFSVHSNGTFIVGTRSIDLAFERADVNLNAVMSDDGSVLGTSPIYPLKPRGIVYLGPPIAQVLRFGCEPQIGEAVITWISIAVIDVGIRPTPVNPRPNYSVGLKGTRKDVTLSVSIAINGIQSFATCVFCVPRLACACALKHFKRTRQPR
ncbi:hypothetical protein A8B82_15105 [Sulfitobacter sp. EhC04]|nr:hypothetical protein [Sulfitobacter sp. EhC04]OAN76720.1 hypothetical protein A8B82_15105 [Sulfitobacter sp. EhC04]